jgi:hypothetical protein
MNRYRISFNKPSIIGKELDYISEAVATGKISGNGLFTQRCQSFFEKSLGIRKCLLTTSCTDALEMAAILADLKPGDEESLRLIHSFQRPTPSSCAAPKSYSPTESVHSFFDLQ